MKVTIEHTTMKFGLFKKVPAISLAVEFSDVERAVITTAGLDKYDLMMPNFYSGLQDFLKVPIQVGTLLKRPVLTPYDDLNAARADEVLIKDALKRLKESIEANSQPMKTKDTFEL